MIAIIKRFTRKFKSYLIIVFFGKNEFAKFSGVRFGKNCRLISTDWGTEPFLITIGDNVTIATGVKFITHDGSTWLMRDEKGRRYSYQRISIGSQVFVGLNSIIMPGVRIDDNVIVAAGSVVTKSVPSNSIVAGVPAKVIGNYCEIEKRMLSKYISDADIDKNKSYKMRILSVLNEDFKPFLEK